MNKQRENKGRRKNRVGRILPDTPARTHATTCTNEDLAQNSIRDWPLAILPQTRHTAHMGTLGYYLCGAIFALFVGMAVMELWQDGTLPVVLSLAMVYYVSKAGRAGWNWLTSRA